MILVTGGAGFIGSVLVKELNKMGKSDILVVDRLEDSDRWRNLNEIKFKEYIHADDLFVPENEMLLSEISIIFHMGACSSTTERNMDYLMDNNFNYSRNLFSLATQLKCPIIYASSAATYGDGALGYDDNHEKIPGLRPMNPYGYSKQLFDEWVLKQEEVPPTWFGLKFFNVYGPNEYHKDDMRSLVHKGFEQIKQRDKVKLFKSHKEGYEDGKQLRDFVYVKDVVRAMLEMAKLKEGSGIYNMGTGQARSFYDLIDNTFKAMGRETKIEFIDMPESIRHQYQYFTEANMNKFKKLLPKFEFSSLEEGVKDYVSGHLMKDNPYAH